MNIPGPLNELLIWQASELGRKRRYEEAEKILSLLENSDDNYKSAAYDLLGRIKISRRKYIEAKAYFQKAIALDPNNTNAREALAYYPRYLRNKKLFKIGMYSLFLLLFIGGVTAVIEMRPFAFSGKPIPIADSSVSKQQDSGREQRPLPGINDVHNESSVRWPEIGIAGVTTNINEREIEIIFNIGLFNEKCEFKEGSLRLLNQVAEELRKASAKLFIVIEGRTDNVPVKSGSAYKDNYSLGKSRAEKVAQFLNKECGIPQNSMLAISIGADDALFSNSSESTRANNRTVSLRARLL